METSYHYTSSTIYEYPNRSFSKNPHYDPSAKTGVFGRDYF